MKHRPQVLAIVALSLFVASLIGFGVASPDFSQSLHPVALLGAHGEPNALAFNLLAFVLPGALLAWVAISFRQALHGASWHSRIGVQLTLLSTLAFAAQGLLPLDPYNLLAPASRWHALSWTLWWVAFVPGALLLACSARARRATGIAFVLLVPLFALLGPSLLPAAIAQRVAFALWFGWWIFIAGRISRGALSASKLSPPT